MDTPKSHNRSKTKFMNNILDDEFHPCVPVCSIIPTNTKTKEDIFKKLRPQSNTVLDYNISQTDTKLDAGDTKIHLQETIAKYVPHETTSKPKRIRVRRSKYFSGGPPKWIFIDEMWLLERKKKQKELREKFKTFVKNRLKEGNHLIHSEHQRILKLVGPEWYQELSPKQLETVDNLKNCILKDLAEDTIINTQENIGYLGLVLRPNHRHIKKALINCCKCPVEFLLILYQLINPNRTTYSINDRLLLSAVVHLTMMDTLRELHIRIPSPPRAPVVTKKAAVKKKNAKYASPYLVPYTFKREPPKFSGIYTNKHVQHPQSPYFCYLEELKIMIKVIGEVKENNTSGPFDRGAGQSNELKAGIGDIEDEIELELRAAQAMYEQLVDFRPVPKLLKPTRYIPCHNFRNKLPESETEEEIVDDTLYCVCAEPSKRSVSCECGLELRYIPDDESESCICVAKKSTCGCVSDSCQRAPNSTINLCGCASEGDEPKDLCQEAPKSTKSLCRCTSENEEAEDSCQRASESTKGSCVCVSNTKEQRRSCTRENKCYVEDQQRQKKSPQQEPEDTCRCASRYEVPEDSWERRISLTHGPRKDQLVQNATQDSYGYAQLNLLNKSKTNSKSTVCGNVRTKSYHNYAGNNSPLSSDFGGTCSSASTVVTAARAYQLKKKNNDQEFESIKSQYGTEKITADNAGYSICDKYNQKKEEPCNHAKDLQFYNKWYHLIRPSDNLKKPCSCKQKYRKFIQAPLCQCNRCQYERKMENITYIISGMKKTESQDMIPIIDRVVEGKLCKCLKKYEDKIIEYELDKEVEDRILCKCRKAVKEMLDTPLCQCARCKEDKRSRAAKFIIKGVKQTDSENRRIIEGISMGKPCECVKEYEKREKRYMSYKQGKDLMTTMKQQEHKYLISGVASTRRGPKYVIAGMRPPINCTCAKQARQEAKDRHMQAIMPHVPHGRIQYQIVGVKETPQGNVYVLESALRTPDCDCMAIFKTFKEQHSVCMKMYEQYLAKTKDEYNEFMKEMLPPSESRRSSRASGSQSLPDEVQEKDVAEEEEIEHETEETVKKCEESEKQNEEDPTEQPDNAKVSQTPTHESKEQKLQKSSVCADKPDFPCDPCRKTCGTNPAFCNCGNPYYCICCECLKIQKVECVRCTCGGQVIECIDCTCGETEVEEEEITLKRFFIFDKILCNPKWQMNVLKKALQSMADDDFPLAKLPESYKLPHFKLWMQMRCRKFWTQKNRYTYIFDSRDFWRHCESCNAWGYSLPDLNLSKDKAHQLNWFHADYVRNLVAQCLNKFYRTVRQNRIHFGREFFPSTFSYAFPFKTWRDCYFAYTPTKEEDVLARFLWQKYDYKNFADYQRFCGLS